MGVPMFANPNIIKVMHGADQDIPWLQRDFGIYVVNLFDTGRAARALPTFDSTGLAYLLRKYAHFEADKKHQLSDWRQRPIPSDMKAYATSDTMYLLDIYDLVRIELEKQKVKNNGICIKTILDTSKDVCLIRYDKEPFKPSSYKALLKSKRGRKKAGVLSEQQHAILRSLFDWRDTIAREEDESCQAVCSNTGLVRIATRCPQNVMALQGLINPLPELVLKYYSQILRIVRQILADDGKGENEFVDAANNRFDESSHAKNP
jgi:exosome complex exonuclease RRP6